jgi:hypothetical protein
MSKTLHPTLALLSCSHPYVLSDPHQYRNLSEPPMLIEGFLPEASVMGLTALPGVGKSWLVMEMMRAVATGGKFLGEYPSKRGGVLFVGSDSSLYDYARQWRRLTDTEYRSHHTAGDLDEVEPNVPYESVRWLIQSSFLFEDPKSICSLLLTHHEYEYGELKPVYNYVYTPSMDDPDEIGFTTQTIADYAREGGFKLIVFDTLSRLTRAEQNSNTEMEQVFGNIRLICEETRAAVILVHHNSKPSEFNDGSDWRGAMSQIGALDSWVNLASKKDDKAIISCSFKKFRGITPSDMRYRMNVMDPETASLTFLDNLDSHFSDPVDGPIPLAIRTALASGPKDGMTIREIATVLHTQFIDEFVTIDKFLRAVRNRLSEKNSPLMQNFIEPSSKDPSGANRYRLRPLPEKETNAKD